MYAMDDYLEMREMEKLPSNAFMAQGFVKNVVSNFLGAGLPINFPWTRQPVQYDVGSYLVSYRETLCRRLRWEGFARVE